MNNTIDRSVEQHLSIVLQKAFEGEKFSASVFFEEWFRQSFYFLFKKNLKVTNISHAELLALLKCYTKFTETRQATNDLQFMSSKEFKESLSELIRAFPLKDTDQHHIACKIASLYATLLCRTVIIDNYFGSAAVRLPSHISLDLESICGKSGYIHSAGKIVYIRSMAKAEKDLFFKALSSHLHDRQDKTKKSLFVIYAHEDFTPYDRDHASELRNGLDDVKLFVEKCYMGKKTIVQVINEMRTEFAHELFIPGAGNFQKHHNEGAREKNVANDKAIWLIIDQDINNLNTKVPGEKSFFVCYEQEYLNANPCHIFNENKPAWIAHTTLPHTLAGAMVSITKPYWPQDGRIKIADPFAGSGTIYFESRKFSRTDVYCSDVDKMTNMIIKDNAYFLTQNDFLLKNCISKLKKFSSHSTKPKAIYTAFTSSDIELIMRAVEYDRATNKSDKQAIQNLMIPLSKVPERDRLIFYLALRTIRRHATAFQRRSIQWSTAFQKEVDILLSQMRHLQKLFESKQIRTKGFMSLKQGMYSYQCVTDTIKAYGGTKLRGCKAVHKDARDIPSGKFDVIVTDPPYGINTTEDREALALLYYEICNKCIEALKSDGQIVICLPEQTRTGQDVPFFTHKEVVIQQMLCAARKNNREVMNPSYSVPKTSNLYRPPFYWESDRALRRAILHFRIRTNS